MARPHLPALDGMRGLAALCVALYHFALYDPRGTFLPHAYLAVDFFFCLSGYVIAGAYEGRLRHGLSFWSFARMRIVRLYPLIFLGSLLALAMESSLLGVDSLAPGLGILFTYTGFSLGLVPYFPAAGGTAFPLNSPMWSLADELIVNLAFAALLRVLSTRVLLFVLAAAGAGLAWAMVAYHGADLGWQPGQMGLGMLRTVFSFTVGVLLFRGQSLFNWVPRLHGAWLGLLLVASFVPLQGGWLYDAGCVTLLFPALVLLGTKARLGARTSRAALWLGAISYPLYALHWPLLERNAYHLFFLPRWALLGCGLAGLAAMALVAHVALKLYDEPLRAALSRPRVAQMPRLPALR